MSESNYSNNLFLRTKIERYLAAGYVIIPLRDKIPVYSNWQKMTRGQVDRKLFENFQSFGFQIPSSVVIIDVDNHNNNKGNESLSHLCEDFDFDFVKHAKMVVKTAGGGLHLYFDFPEEMQGCKIVNALQRYPSIEFKSKGRQVVIPESVLLNGKKYEQISGELTNESFLPKQLCDLIKRDAIVAEKPAKLSNLKAENFTDSEADIAAFDNFLMSQAPSAAGDYNNHKYRIAAQAKNLGISPKVLLPKLMDWDARVNVQPMSADEVKSIILNAYNYSNEGVSTKSLIKVFGEIKREEPQKKYADKDLEIWVDQLIKTEKGKITKSHFGTRNTEIFLKNLPETKDKLALNLFTMDSVWLETPTWRKKINDQTLKQEVENPEDSDKIEKQPPLTDDDIVVIRGILNDAEFDPSPAQVHEAVRAVALEKMFHPVKDYFESLPEWDGVRRLDEFFHKYCGTPQNEYFAQVGRKIFTAVVTRVYIPGAKFDYTPVLVGGQGKAKSSFIKAMAIRPTWFSDSLGDIENKDVILQMRSKLIIENAEMAMTSKKAVTIQKAFLSRSTDRARLPYERLPRDIPRQCIFIATTNEDRFLIDETGNRRFWPIPIEKLDIEGVRKNIDKLYAEAIHWFKKGEMLFLDPEVEKMAEKYQSERFAADEWQEKIQDWLEDKKPEHVDGKEIWTQCIGRMDVAGFDIKMQKRIANILKALGWHSAVIYKDGKSLRRYKKQEYK